MLIGILAVPATGQPAAAPSRDDPRLQTLVYRPGDAVRLVAFPDAALKLLFHPGELVERVVVSDRNTVRAAVVGGGDALELSPLSRDVTAELTVLTNIRQYRLSLETGDSPEAAHLVRLVSDQKEGSPIGELRMGVGKWDYIVSGDRVIRPTRISDDGSKTFIEWRPDQALPAVLGIGPSGEEEVVAGYMRGGIFVIDRIYPALVFRIDKQRAEARRGERRS